ncbi:deoxyribose-phosphate aldolase [Anaerovorax odorimutans]|uniref:deoxyribose-phosphate aldolase n=1 Tax=Anaerovorax odorimutans TaxID=109327 RepID=UPI0004153FE9|nr:deoxyribose-phosphate aldolase [Anaerovorax odorimutans]
MKNLNQYFDHTMLKAEATENDIKKICNEAKEYEFYAVCVNSSYVETAKKELKGTKIKVACVVGFPLGACTTEVKGFETNWACKNGANEIDMVINLGAFKDKRYDYVLKDIKEVVEVAEEYNAIVKVILETCLLSDDEIIKACEISKEAGAAFVKTSTGFNSSGATADHIKLMKDTVGNEMQVKASGGIRTLEKALEMINAGADRIGSSSSVFIINENKNL